MALPRTFRNGFYLPPRFGTPGEIYGIELPPSKEMYLVIYGPDSNEMTKVLWYPDTERWKRGNYFYPKKLLFESEECTRRTCDFECYYPNCEGCAPCGYSNREAWCVSCYGLPENAMQYPCKYLQLLGQRFCPFYAVRSDEIVDKEADTVDKIEKNIGEEARKNYDIYWKFGLSQF